MKVNYSAYIWVFVGYLGLWVILCISMNMESEIVGHYFVGCSCAKSAWSLCPYIAIAEVKKLAG